MAYIEVNIDIDDLYDSLRTSDKERIIELLRYDELLTDDDLLEDEGDVSGMPSIMEQYFIDDLNSLKTKYFSLSAEDIELIKMLNKKY